jgi:hypothetical protein
MRRNRTAPFTEGMYIIEFDFSILPTPPDKAKRLYFCRKVTSEARPARGRIAFYLIQEIQWRSWCYSNLTPFPFLRSRFIQPIRSLAPSGKRGRFDDLLLCG